MLNIAVSFIDEIYVSSFGKVVRTAIYLDFSLARVFVHA